MMMSYAMPFIRPQFSVYHQSVLEAKGDLNAGKEQQRRVFTNQLPDTRRKEAAAQDCI